MIFTSYTFFFFLIITFLLYYLIPKKFQWVLLLIASGIFYAYAGLKFLIYIMATILSTYLFSIKISQSHEEQELYLKVNKSNLSRGERKEYREKTKATRWKLLVFCLIINFGILAVIKYADFAIANINSSFSFFNVGKQLSFANFAVPLGISFYTFQTMGYIIDI